MAADRPEPPITLHPHDRHVRVVIDGTLIADTTCAIELRERGYPPRQYLPRDDVRMERLTPSDTLTHCLDSMILPSARGRASGGRAQAQWG
ncbi:DUF427 domain-containing protein [Halomonas campisalis]|uniref:DUF427 domain-containing protein n=1 Tax=Billgrantia campisalis TaxID=74661 RepID=A0ABS9PDI7_9GAMM|nr:DUF427 domain-containing protein [Halomonas campisalis]MCG6659796.1 DUF427 domain-containing protein [Halomonas campisalis]MDR5864950.1 DUF427 domain-containing protein [Halomonas campisalis]